MASVEEKWFDDLEKTRLENAKTVTRSTLEIILEKADEADIYGLLSGISGFAQHVLKPTKNEGGTQQKPSKVPQHGGNYL